MDTKSEFRYFPRMVKIGIFAFKEGEECERLYNGWRIYPEIVKSMKLTLDDFQDAKWSNGSLIVENWS